MKKTCGRLNKFYLIILNQYFIHDIYLINLENKLLILAKKKSKRICIKINMSSSKLITGSKKENAKHAENSFDSKLLQACSSVKSIIDNSLDGYALVGADYKVISFNSGIHQFIKKGFGTDIQLDIDIITLFNDFVKEIVIAELPKVLAGGRYEIESNLEGVDGKPNWYQVRIFPSIDQSNKIVGAVFCVRDINHTKLSDAEYQTFFNSSLGGFFIVDITGDLIEVNDAYVNMIGYSRAELLKMKIHDVEANEDKIETQRRIRMVSIIGSDRFETRHRTKSGKLLDLEINVTFKKSTNRFYVFLQDISKRKEAEMEFKKSLIHYKHLFENHTAIKIIVDTENGNIYDANYAAALYYGWTREELKKLNLSNINISLSHEMLNKELQVIKNSKSIHRFFKHRKRNGEVRDIEVFGNPININGRTYIHAIIFDITDRKKTETELLESEQNLKHGEQIANFGNLKITLDDQMVYLSEGAASIYGIDNRIITYEELKIYRMPEYNDKLNETMKALLQENKDYNIEFKIKNGKTGKVTDVHLICEYDAKTKTVFAVLKDITDTKNTYNDLLKLNRLYAFVNSVNDLIIDVKEQQKLFDEINKIAVSKGGFIMCWIGIVNNESKGIKPVSIAGKDEGYIDNLIAEDGEHLTLGLGPSAIAVKNHKTVIVRDFKNDLTVPKETRIQATQRGYKSGIVLPIFVTGNLFGVFVLYSTEVDFFSNETEILLLEKIAQNIAFSIETIISEENRKKAEADREKIALDLIQRNKDLEQFTYIVSHNLRHPVANIIGFNSVLNEMQLSVEDRNEMYDGINVSVLKLDEVIKDLNNILQVKHNISEIKENVIFFKLMSDVKHSLMQEISLSGAVITHNFEEINEILTIKSYMQSVFLNLISNSIKYRQPDIKPVISVTFQKIENGIQIIFKDNGLGIDLKKQGDKLFGLYKRFHTKYAEGKGVGLFMVKTQLQSLGGNIEVKSEPNVGTEWIVTLNY